MSISFADIEAAAKRIEGVAHRTPIKTSRILNERSAYQLYFKCENLQRIGAFKFRGAYNCISKIAEQLDSKDNVEILAYSSGNHAQAVALASQLLGFKATVCMPEDAPESKIDATRSYGAEILFYNRMKEERTEFCAQVMKDKEAQGIKIHLVPPFDHPDIMAGQGTAAYELLQDIPDLDAIILPVSGGGLLAGNAVAAKSMRPEIKVFGVEPELGNDAYLSFRKGERVSIDPPNTIADGLRNPYLGELTFPIIQEYVDDILLVSEEEIKESMKLIFSRMKLVIEPSGGVAAAAVLHGKLQDKIPAGSKVAIVLSGGNVDLEALAEIFAV